MNLGEAITLLKFRLGSRTDEDLDTLIQVEMAQAQFELERSGDPPWFLLTNNTSFFTVAGNRQVAIPGNFLLEAEEDGLWVEDDQGNLIPLEKGEFDASLEYWGNQQGFPRGYALAGHHFSFFPIPDKAYRIWMRHYAADISPSTLTVSQTNLWLTHGRDLLLARTGRRMATYLRDTELAQIFAAEEITAANRLKVENVARAEANRSRSKGD